MTKRIPAPDGFPTLEDFIWQTLKSIERLGGSATRSEIEQDLTIQLQLTDEMLEFKGTGKTTTFRRRASWALTYLKYAYAVENSERGVWSITSIGKAINETEISGIVKKVKQKWKPVDTAIQTPDADNSDTATDADDESNWRDFVLQRVRLLTPAAFERLCQRILREAGFMQVEITGRSGDNGIDGRGLLRVGLISFHVIFQCKKYADSVGPKELRDFRGAMSGRTDKGLFMTTGRFSKSAREEANREGVPPIELIDGEAIAELLKQFKLGVDVEIVEQVSVREKFFSELAI